MGLVQTRRRLWGSSVLAALVLSGVAMLGAGEGAPETDRALQASLRGAAEPSKAVDLTAPLSAIVSEIQVSETQRVKSGELLVQMDDAIPKLQVELNKYRLKVAEGERDYAKHDLENKRKLLNTDASGEGEVRRAELEYTTSESAVGVAREELNVAREQWNQFKINAPFDGEVKTILAKKGARMNQGDVVLQFVSRYELEVRLYLPVSMLYEIQVGKEYVFDALEPVKRQVKGTLKSVDHNINSATGKFRVVFTIDNRDLKLPSGFQVKLVWPQMQGSPQS